MVFVLLTVYPSSTIKCQDTPDLESNIEELNFDSLRNMYRALYLNDIDSAAYIADIHYRKAEVEGNKIELLRALNNKAINFAMNRDFKAANIMIDQAIAIKQEVDVEDPKTYYNAGFVYAYTNKAKAIRYYEIARQEYETKKDSASVADISGNIAHMCMLAGNLEKALKYLEEAKDIYEKLPGGSVDPYILQNIGKIKLSQGKYHEAIYHLEEAEASFEKERILIQTVYSKAYKSEAFYGLGLHEEAASELVSASRISDSLDYDAGKLYINPVLARQFIKSDIKKADEYLMKAIAVDDHKKSYDDKAKIYLTLSHIEKEKGNLEESLKMHKLYSLYKDSLLHQHNEVDMVKEQLDIEHENSLEEMKKVYEEDRNKLEKTHSSHLTLLSFFGLIFLLGGALFFGMRLKKHKREKELLLKELDTLKSEQSKTNALNTEGFALDREKIETIAGKAINETDWKVMNVLLEDPVISNKELAKKVFLSVDGVGSSLRRMYRLFDIKESRYMKISLIMKLMKISTTRNIEGARE